MEKLNFTINEKGVLEPPSLHVTGGDIVSFEATASDVVLCFNPSIFFGAKRIEIAKGEKVALVVPDPPMDSEFSLYSCSDLTYQFGDPVQAGKGSMGSGKVTGSSSGQKRK